MKRLAVLLLALAACTPAEQDVLARDAARSTVVPVVQAQLPGVPVTPVANCVIDNATAPEILTLASATLTGVTPQTQDLVIRILARPGTVNCLTTTGLTGVLAGLQV
ncbi:MAG: hypothetical protein AAGE76_08170 [Pseudomonadota bacterium]